MPFLSSRNDCTGCAACANICRKSAIIMHPDEEGFLQPIINQEQCVECGLCEKICPALHPQDSIAQEFDTYAVIDYIDRNKSSSGGAFSLFARYVLKKGGVVYGATINDGLQVFHTKVENVDDLDILRGSKYVQSAIGYVYLDIKRELDNGKFVLFCGSPCQVAGLYAFLGKHYDNKLITLDLVCHGVPNQVVFNAYLNKLKDSSRLSVKNKNFEGFRFRKLNSWDYRPAIKFTKTKWQVLEQEDNAYMNAFFDGILYRESCFHCQYANLNRIGDFTIADFWGIGRHGKRFKKNVSSGVSLVLDNKRKMKSLYEELKMEAYIERRDIKEALAENHNLHDSVVRLPERDLAIKDMLNDQISLKDFCIKYNYLKKENLGYYINKFAKQIIYALGLYNIYKTIKYKL